MGFADDPRKKEGQQSVKLRSKAVSADADVSWLEN
jgi:hypothetical protein